MDYPYDLFGLRGKVAAITGGARGIGAETARMLAAAGARVAVLDVLEADGKATAEAICAAGGEAAFWKLDVTREDEVARVFTEIAERFGGLGILVNNAGIEGPNAPTHELALEQWQQVMAVNVTGTFLCTKHAIAHMERAGGGAIVNVSSMYGIAGGPDVPPYHASKAAVRMMAKTDALLYAGKNIRANSIHPGFIRTPMLEHVAQASGQGEGLFHYLGGLTPAGKVGQPRDIAAGILYLVSDAGRYVTGAELVIDGGYTAR
ncbi:SDR family NAD(P)-dependent oxidoreductase [Cupriavidus alkaliphilus]|uniref:SDR family NAD(P)-dependent oxidoreductase n=1 Tax=Cupriavidus alkaliphilus TaxID=942866 RepID=UPI001610DDB2|nr:SDR family NAD(P)-dependent oxidoreductase [Cupriavidus alkaliphilus]MBB3015727.1 NAD(P)-dependent dehydrogenase (short-subunit alcohol dehydrogenase family) [Cupriavidus alkaliphilus]